MAFEVLFLIGRILYGGVHAFFGLNHFMKAKDMSGYAKSKGIPMPGLSNMIAGLLLLAGGLSLLFGAYVQLGVWALVIFYIPTSLMMHNFWAVKDEEKMMQMVNFMKNMAMLGAALMFLQLTGSWEYALNI